MFRENKAGLWFVIYHEYEFKCFLREWSQLTKTTPRTHERSYNIQVALTDGEERKGRVDTMYT